MVPFLLIFACIFSIIAYVIYFFDLKNLSVKPNRFSWLIWSLSMSLETITYYFISQDITKSFFFIISTLACIILTYKIWVNSDWSKPSNLDLVSFAFCIISILVWMFFESVWLAHLIVLMAIPIGFFPAFSNALVNYNNENSKAWYFWAISDFIAIVVIVLRLQTYKELPYALTEFLSHIIVIAILLFGFHKAKKAGYTIKANRFGKGVYTTKSFANGETILKFEGQTMFINDEIMEKLGGPIDHYLQIGDHLYMGPSGKADDFVNHSCNPNAGLNFTINGIFLKAITNITADTEITFDYSTCTSSTDLKMPCLCNENNCRKFIGPFVDLDHNLQANYINLDIVAPFVKNTVTVIKA